MKLCKQCRETKDLGCFSRHPNTRDKLQPVCKDCNKLNCKKAYAKSEDKLKYNKWKRGNPEAANTAARARRSKPEIKAKHNVYNRGWFARNKEKRSIYQGERRASQLRATPPWLTEQQMQDINEVYLTRPDGWHVDHIVPLQGENVCGLHVSWNLQHLPMVENCRKSNK